MNIHYWDRHKSRDLKMKEMFLGGKTLGQLASHFHIGTQGVRVALRKQGVKFSKKSLRKTSACFRQKELVMEMCAEGRSLESIARAVGTVGRHVKRFLREHGVTREFVNGLKKERNPNWKGGRILNKNGYVDIHCPNHPNARKHTPYIAEHRLVMEKMIGRFLLPKEVVHHIDGNKQNNSPENLRLFSENGEHLAHELRGRVPRWTPEGLARMRKGVLRSAAKKRGKKTVRLKAGGCQYI